jgi:hypothetical protein
MKWLPCKRCKEEEVEVPENRASAVCKDCIELESKEKAYAEVARLWETLKSMPIYERRVGSMGTIVAAKFESLMATSSSKELEDAKNLLEMTIFRATIAEVAPEFLRLVR